MLRTWLTDEDKNRAGCVPCSDCVRVLRGTFTACSSRCHTFSAGISVLLLAALLEPRHWLKCLLSVFRSAMPLVQRIIEPRYLCRGTLPDGVASELECVTNSTLAAVIKQLGGLSECCWLAQ